MELKNLKVLIVRETRTFVKFNKNKNSKNSGKTEKVCLTFQLIFIVFHCI